VVNVVKLFFRVIYAAIVEASVKIADKCVNYAKKVFVKLSLIFILKIWSQFAHIFVATSDQFITISQIVHCNKMV